MASTILDASNPALIKESTEIKIYDSFDHLDLPENLLRGIYAHGFTKPSAIQSKGIKPMVDKRDTLAQAQSGTGKTGTFVIGSLSGLDPSIPKPQIMVLVHTRELADQIHKVFKSIGQFMKVKVLWAVGGNNLRDDIRALEEGVHVIVGCPGRVYDLASRGLIDRSNMRYLILDEADQMLTDLFYKQVMCILEKGFPATTQVALFSATMPETVISVAEKILKNPVRILIPPDAVKLDGIVQYFVPISRIDYKVECLADLYKNLNIAQAVIFCNQRKTAEHLAQKMTELGYPITCLHGELDKKERQKRMTEFMSGDCRAMIATDIIARGIDVQQLSLVINYELPNNREDYVHRIGRAGRFGRKGTTINLLLPEEEPLMKDIVEHYHMVLQELPERVDMIAL